MNGMGKRVIKGVMKIAMQEINASIHEAQASLMKITLSFGKEKYATVSYTNRIMSLESRLYCM